MKTLDQLIKHIGKNIVEIRKIKGLRQSDLAAIIDMEDSSLRRIERGRTNTTIKMLFRIASALEVDFYDLIK